MSCENSIDPRWFVVASHRVLASRHHFGHQQRGQSVRGTRVSVSSWERRNPNMKTDRSAIENFARRAATSVSPPAPNGFVRSVWDVHPRSVGFYVMGKTLSADSSGIRCRVGSIVSWRQAPQAGNVPLRLGSRSPRLDYL